jgi:hypothetical protein
VGRAEQRCDVWVELLHALATARSRAHQNQSPHERGSIDGDLLGDKSPIEEPNRSTWRYR